ncbi:sterile alpha motif domain-containing protein 9-like [Lampetra fluviatilis]
MIHPLVAKQVLEEFESTNRSSRFSIAKELLAEDILFNNGMGREHLVKNVRNMFVIRHHKEQGDETDSLFAPLIEDIIKHKDKLLLCATDRFSKDAILAQALARYCYLKDNNFDEAKKWAEHAKKLVKNSSYITDTIGQIYKHELKQKFDVSAIEKKGFLPPSDLNKALQLAKSASDFFREAQELVKTEDDAFNTAGFFGDIEVATHMLQLFELTKVFHKTGEIHKRTLVAYLNGRMDLSRLPTDDEEEKATAAAQRELSEGEQPKPLPRLLTGNVLGQCGRSTPQLQIEPGAQTICERAASKLTSDWQRADSGAASALQLWIEHDAQTTL